ncbi:MFS transporter, PHS family, inorganic phosphate transporter, partial [Lecanoromycetidae sp. Uapishka_2]
MKWEEEGYTRKDDNGNFVSIEEYEAEQAASLRGMSRVMTRGDLKLYAICGVGFFLDSYDLFIINLVTPVWTYEYWGGLQHKKSPVYPLLLRGAVNAAANIGNIIGQLSFGFLGDAFGRKFVYGKELIIMIIGVILIISLPNHLPGPTRNKFWYLFGMRILMGIGIGGDYPMSAAIVAERSSLRNRGRMLGWIFSNQGWGTLASSIVTLILIGCFSGSLKAGHYSKLDGLWRLQIGLALVPALITLYFRLTMPESKKYLQSTEISSFKSTSIDSFSTNGDDVKDPTMHSKEVSGSPDKRASIVEANLGTPATSTKLTTFVTYFSEWRHLKTLIGTSLAWFLVDVSFYGTNLNQSVLLADIGFASGKTEYQTLLKTGYGNLIIAAAGYVPGYFLTIYFIEILGRRWIQIQGFLVSGLMFGIIAGDYKHLGTAGKFLFFNFGPNATTFIVPGEVYPSRVRGFAHGVSAATGKVGAILSGVLFNYLSSEKIGIANTLWIFFACSMAGAVVTFLFVPETKGVDADVLDYEECQQKVVGKVSRGGGQKWYLGATQGQH